MTDINSKLKNPGMNRWPYFAWQWHITDECDQRCKHCYIFSGENKSCLKTMSREEMTTTLARCVDFCSKVHRRPYFYLTGGDPILHPDFWNLLEKLHEKQIPFTILGNPFHLDDEVCRRLKELGCQKYQLSLDGLEQTHDWFRKPGSYRTTLEKISCINKAGITSVIMSTVSSTNIEEIPQLIDEVVAAGAGLYAFGRYCPQESEMDAMVEPLVYRDFLRKCDERFRYWRQKGASTWFSKKDHLWTLYDYENGRFQIPEARSGMIYDGCHCGNSHWTILPDGSLYACRRVVDSKIGNIFTDDLMDLWFNQMEEYRNYEEFEKCSKCELLAWCRGCPAVAKGFSGSFYAADPQCWKEIPETVD